MATPVKTVNDFYLAAPGVPAFYNLPNGLLISPVITGLTTGTIKVTATQTENGFYYGGVFTVSYRGVVTPPWQNPTDPNTPGYVGSIYTSAFADGSYGFVWDQRGTLLSPGGISDQNVYGRSAVATQFTNPATTFTVAAVPSSNDFLVDSLVTTDGRVASLVLGGNTSGSQTLRLYFSNPDGSGLSFVSLSAYPASGGFLPWYQMAQQPDGSFQVFAMTGGNLLISEVSSAGVYDSWANTYSIVGAPPPIKSHDVAAVVGQNGSSQGTLQVFEENVSATSWKLTLHHNGSSGGNGGSVTVATGTQANASDPHYAQLAQLQDGRFVVIWADAGTIYGRLANILGSNTPTVEGLTFVVAQGPGGTTAYRPTIDVLADGRFGVSWHEAGTVNGNAYTTVKMNIFDPREASVTLNAVAAGSGFVGTAFADTMNGNVGSDSLDGGAGADRLSGLGNNDVLNGGGGNDTIDGGTGLDTASYVDDTQAVAANLFGGFAVQNFGQPGAAIDTLLLIENVTGGSNDDFLIGDNTANRLEGGGGADNLWGYGGNDTLIGGDGSDIIVGGDNDDSLESGLGQDWLYGQGGADTLRATDATANAFNVLVGGDGNDTLFGGPTGFDYFYGGDGATAGGNDSFVIVANSGVKVMNDFEAGGVSDVVRLLGTPLTTFSQVQANLSFSATINGTVLVVDGGTQLWFLGLQPNQLTASDFLFA